MDKRQPNPIWIQGFSDVEIRIGNQSVAGANTSTDVNELCGIFGASNDFAVTVTCSQPITGRYVTLGKTSDRFELAELSYGTC